MSTRSWTRRVGAAVVAWCVLASLVGGSAASANMAASPLTPWAWGYNGDGQLGNGTTTNSPTPVQVSGLWGTSTIAGGGGHSMALKPDGTVWTWGRNDYGQLGNNTTTNSPTPVEASAFAGATAIAGGRDHSLAVSNGGVWAWGRNDSGQLGNGSTFNDPVPTPVSGLRGWVTAVAGGGSFSLALSGGAVWAWGNNFDYQLGDGCTQFFCKTPVQVSLFLSGVTAIAAGETHSLALKSDGTVRAWGYNGDGQLGNGSTTSSSTPVLVSGLSGVTAIAGGGYHSLAVKSDGTVWAWGDNGYGQLGNGITGSISSTPVKVSGLTGVIAIAGGFDHSLALKSDGTVWAWGRNDSGQLGNASATGSSTPVPVNGLSGATAIAAGQAHSLATATPTSPCSPAIPSIATQTASSTNQYSLSNSDGITWQDIDSVALSLICAPNADQSTVLTANADLWTGSAGFNQDIGIFVSDSGGADTLLAWKESGGFAGTSSPNAAYVQSLYPMASGHSYVFKLKWKTNKNAPGSTIYAGAGNPPGPFSPTSLIAETFTPGGGPNFALSTSQYTLANSDGATWQTIDGVNLATTLAPAVDSTTVLGANVDLWTANAGINQDIAMFVSDNGGAFSLVAWKESGGFAGTFSPNAAFVKATYPMTGGHTYVFRLEWKSNKNAPGTTIYAGAGPISGQFSPSSLFAQTIAAGANPYTAVSTTQYTLNNSDGTNWQLMDPNLNVTVAAGANTNSILGANADLFTNTAGYNQDIGIFVSDNGGADTMVAWKESGGFAGTFSPNAAFAQYTYQMTSGHTYVFKLKWKTNKNSPGTTIYAAAGPGPAPFSPTRLTVELTN